MTSLLNDKQLTSLATLLQTNRLDGDLALSELEALAVAKLMEEECRNDIKAALRSDRDGDSSKLQEYRLTVNGYYRTLKQTRPQPQTIYIDLSNFEDFYRSEVQPQTDLPFEQWQEEYLTELRNLYKVDGISLGVNFTTRQPFGEEYTRVVVAGEPAAFALNDIVSNEEKILFVNSLLNSDDSEVKKSALQLKGEITREFFKEHPGERPEPGAILQSFFDHKYIGRTAEILMIDDDRNRLGRVFSHHYGNTDSDQFGNPDKNDLVVVYGDNFLTSAHGDQSQIDRRVGSDLDLLAQAIAETTAHEVGHALGLEHPHSGSCRKNTHLMSLTSQRLKHSGRSAYFNDYAVAYLAHILGVQS